MSLGKASQGLRQMPKGNPDDLNRRNNILNHFLEEKK